jgi:alpha-ketoglutarate-dependent taurine dioxygenase
MKSIHVVNVESVEQIVSGIDEYVSLFKSLGVIAFRGAKSSRQEQLQITKLFGDLLGIHPNSSDGKEYWEYGESHKSSLARLGVRSKSEILVPWHLEHFGYPNPAIGGVWNMEKFTCESENGSTLFVNTADIFQNLSNEQKDFLRKCTISALPSCDDPLLPKYPSVFKVVQTHRYSGREILRMKFKRDGEITTGCSLVEFNENRPSEYEKQMFSWYEQWFGNQVCENQSIRQAHHWREGDLVIVDLMVMVHAVLGGFADTERFFNGMWMHQSNTSKYGNQTSSFL